MGDNENLDHNSLESEKGEDNENGENFHEQEIVKAKNSVMCPEVGMEFESHQEAYSYYNSYARCVGFGTKRYSTRKSQRNGDVIGHKFCCICQGARNSKRTYEELKRIRGDFRTNCKGSMSVKKGKYGNWIVSHVVEEHNHALATPNKVHNFRSHRNIDDGHAEVIKNMHSVGVRTNLMKSFLTLEAGGHRNLGSKEQDARNFLSKRRTKKLSNEDATAVLDYLERQKIENPSFFYSIQVDSEGHMTNFFWTDAKSRMDYHYFGDVVCFDPTYLTNCYGMPFAPIIGVNHHYQTTIFGGALLFDETEESFAWVMMAWMKAMEGKEPRVILTDQESAIGGAISRILPNAQHRFCSWHIMRNALENIAHVFNTHKGFRYEFEQFLYGFETVEEFETQWEKMLDTYTLRDNEWLMKLYQKKNKWAAVYSRDVFSASMYSTQRSESINSYFDGYLKKSLPLCEFVQQYERAVDARREQENDADFQAIVKRPMLKIEKEASKIYTPKIFEIFQEELVNGLSYHLELNSKSQNVSTFFVWKNDKQAFRTVTFDYSNYNVKCTCKLYEFAGYLCRHVLKVFLVLDVQSIPPQYILKRWTKDAKYGAVVNKQGKTIQANCHVPVTIRFNNICREANNIAAKASRNQHVYNIAIDGLHKTLMNVECALKNMTSKDQFEVEKLEDTSQLSNRRLSKKLLENATSICGEIGTQNRDYSKFSQVADKSLSYDVSNSAPSSNPFAGICLVSPTESNANPGEATAKLQSSMERIAETVEELRTSMIVRSLDTSLTIKHVMAVVRHLPGMVVGSALWWKASALLIKQPMREMFLAQEDPELKLQWLEQTSELNN